MKGEIEDGEVTERFEALAEDLLRERADVYRELGSEDSRERQSVDN
jgi:hypothetical protein